MAEASSQANVPSLGEELGSIAARAQTYTGASGSAIALSEGDVSEMICRACSGPAAPDIGASIRLEGTFTGMAVQSGQALRCDDSDTDKRVDAAACRALGTRSIVVVPIRDADTEVVMGVLAVFAGTKNSFNDLHVAVLRTMAREVAVSVQKAKKAGITLSTMSIPVYVDPPPRPSNPGFTPPVTTSAPRPAPTPPPMPATSAAAAAPKTAPIAEPAPTMMSPAPRPAAPPPPPPPAPAKLAPPVPPPPPKEDPLAPQPMAAPIKHAAKAATPPPAPEWKPAPPPPVRKIDTPAESHKAEAPRPVSFGTFDNVAADKKPGGGGMMIWVGVAAAIVLIIGGYFAYSHFSGGGSTQPQPAQSQPQQQPPQAASTPAPTAASPTPAPATQTASTAAASQPATSQTASKPTTAPAQPAPQPQQQAAKPEPPPQQAKPTPQQQQVVARTLSTPTPSANAPRQEDIPHALPAQAPQVAVPMTTSAPTLAAAKVSQSTQAQLISSVQPKYPEMARTMHASGDVVVEAKIGTDGAVKSTRVLSGHALLRSAAENAVKQWRYKPATLNGQPVEATTQVTVKFAPQ